jgi:hypothetical protein
MVMVQMVRPMALQIIKIQQTLQRLSAHPCQFAVQENRVCGGRSRKSNKTSLHLELQTLQTRRLNKQRRLQNK